MILQNLIVKKSYNLYMLGNIPMAVNLRVFHRDAHRCLILLESLSVAGHQRPQPRQTCLGKDMEIAGVSVS
jgi:hypothetical protein